MARHPANRAAQWREAQFPSGRRFADLDRLVPRRWLSCRLWRSHRPNPAGWRLSSKRGQAPAWFNPVRSWVTNCPCDFVPRSLRLELMSTPPPVFRPATGRPGPFLLTWWTPMKQPTKPADKAALVKVLRRIAAKLRTRSVSCRQFVSRSGIPEHQVPLLSGSHNGLVDARGLVP